MNFPTEQLRLYVLTRHQTGTATKDIIHEMTQVLGKDNVPSQNTTYIVGYKTLKMEYGLAKKISKKLRAVKPKLTRRNLMLVPSLAHPPDSLFSRTQGTD